MVCHALHSVNSRLCRWLLQSQDMIGGNTVHLTQEFLSHMLGVRRNTVSVEANTLQAAGLIKYARGKITIVDPLSDTNSFAAAQHDATLAFPVLAAVLFGAAILVSTLGSGVTLRRFLRV